MIAHRRDIDGLRALAIVPVLLFHSGLAVAPGGYVGVDVFFVISGYLITAIIAGGIDSDRFSLAAFYERRARRILPALLVMIGVVLIAAWLFMVPDDFARLPGAALMAIFFVSNIGYFLQTGYFASGIDTLPLLHTWSLAVEEQFYLGFPLLLLAIARWAPAWRTVIISGLTLLSFGLALLTQADGSGFAFYLLPPRAWELCVGALLAVRAVPPVASRIVRELLAITGLVAILYAVTNLDKASLFPGGNALYPVVGAALILHCAPATLVGSVLAMRVPVAIGLISYSLYLWHWPLILFSEYVTDQKLTGTSSLIVIAASFVVAALSWRLVEQPLRDRARIAPRRLIMLTRGAVASLSVAAIALAMTAGWPSRFTPAALRMLAARDDISPARARCLVSEIGTHDNECTLGARVPPTSLLWGDSHGVEMAWAISERLAPRGLSLLEQTRASCPPIPDYQRPTDPDCHIFNDHVLRLIGARPALRTIILAGYWVDKAYASPANLASLDRLMHSLVRQGRTVVLISAVPEQPFDVPRRLVHLVERGRPIAQDGVAMRLHRQRSAWIRRAHGRWRSLGVTIIDPADMLCDSRRCAIERAGVPLYFDRHHLSLSGARLVARYIPSALFNP